MGIPKKLKYLTIGDPEKSRSLTEIVDAEYLAKQNEIQFVSTEHHYRSAYEHSKKVEIFDRWWPWKVMWSLTEILDAEYLANGMR